MSYSIKVRFDRELDDDLDAIGLPPARMRNGTKPVLPQLKALALQFRAELQSAYDAEPGDHGQLPMAGSFEIESITVEGHTLTMKKLGL